ILKIKLDTIVGRSKGYVMSFRIIIFLSYIVFVSVAIADSDEANRTFQQYIDEKQEKISKEVVELFDNIDKKLAYWIYTTDSNEISQSQTKSSIDEFFKGEKYIKESNKSYIQIRLKTLLQSQELSSLNARIKAQIPLERTKNSFQIFFNDIGQEPMDNAISELENKKSAQIGVNYFAPDLKEIKSKYSIGLRGLSTYVSARYSKEFELQKWIIEPTQEFEYSTKYDFSEETNIYFDRPFDEHSLFRTTLHRKTQAGIDGFDYALTFSYYQALSKKKGFGVAQRFWGNSKYSCDEEPDEFSGISNYTTQFSWRQNIFRKWVAYEIQPIVSFHRQYNYEANYMLRFYLDFYFGNID
ncbi:MAG: hypothetical protein Q7T50_04570, partial [Candidatus Magasanikbacteria bacterium]|nr:hypothetical protein [Candidatus Magasanikbacteria bacterium]